MITVDEAFEKFRQRLELSKTESENAQKRHAEVRECIRGGFDIDRDFLTGSYARHTKTKPLKDVDVFFCLGDKEKKWRDRPPKEILDAFQACLVKKYGKDAVDPGRRCVTVEFEKNTTDEEGKVLSIDAVPAFERGDCYEIPDRDLGKWIKSDPEVHAEQSTAKNKTLEGKWVPLVKMIKRWNRSADKPITVTGGVVGLKGNLAPEGAIVKVAGMSLGGNCCCAPAGSAETSARVSSESERRRAIRRDLCRGERMGRGEVCACRGRAAIPLAVPHRAGVERVPGGEEQRAGDGDRGLRRLRQWGERADADRGQAEGRNERGPRPAVATMAEREGRGAGRDREGEGKRVEPLRHGQEHRPRRDRDEQRGEREAMDQAERRRADCEPVEPILTQRCHRNLHRPAGNGAGRWQ